MAHFQLRNTLIPDRRLPMPGRVVVFGCTLDADVPIQHESVSERHALLEASAEGYMLSDLGSAEGTFIRDRRLAPGERRPLEEGDTFRLGRIEVVLASDEEILPADDEEMHLEPEGASSPGNSVAAATSPVGHSPVVSASRERAPGKPEGKNSHVPAARRRAEKLRAKRTAFFWAGIAVTVLLLALAAFFIYRIASQQGSGSAKGNVEQSPR